MAALGVVVVAVLDVVGIMIVSEDLCIIEQGWTENVEYLIDRASSESLFTVSAVIVVQDDDDDDDDDDEEEDEDFDSDSFGIEYWTVFEQNNRDVICEMAATADGKGNKNDEEVTVALFLQTSTV